MKTQQVRTFGLMTLSFVVISAISLVLGALGLFLPFGAVTLGFGYQTYAAVRHIESPSEPVAKPPRFLDLFNEFDPLRDLLTALLIALVVIGLLIDGAKPSSLFWFPVFLIAFLSVTWAVTFVRRRRGSSGNH